MIHCCLDKDEVNFYDANKVWIYAKAVLIICNENLDTILLNVLGGEQSLKMLYGLPMSKQVRDHLKASNESRTSLSVTYMNSLATSDIKQAHFPPPKIIAGTRSTLSSTILFLCMVVMPTMDQG